jgi:Flp pilus assembly protein protease CpaA
MFVALVVIATLMYASYRDLLTREIPEVVWLPAYLIAIAGVLMRFLGGYYAPLEVFLSLMPALVYLILFLVGLLGGADFLALLLVTIAHLHEPLIPLLTFVISSLIPVPLILLNLVENTIRSKKIMESIVCVQGTKKFLYFVGRPATATHFLKKKYVFLHTYPTEGGYICSSSVDVDIDFEKQREIVAEALRRGLMKPEDYVIYSPALPHVTFIGLSYPVALLVGLYFFTAFI